MQLELEFSDSLYNMILQSRPSFVSNSI